MTKFYVTLVHFDVFTFLSFKEFFSKAVWKRQCKWSLESSGGFLLLYSNKSWCRFDAFSGLRLRRELSPKQSILSFASLREAELWKDSVPEIKQFVPVCHIPRSPFLCIRVIRLFRAVDFLHIDRGLHMGKSV